MKLDASLAICIGAIVATIIMVIVFKLEALEDDTVEFWGKVKGLKEYETTLGSVNTVPEIDVLYLDVLKKGDQ